MTDTEYSDTDVIYAPALGSERLLASRWNDFVNGYDDGSGLMTFEVKEAEILERLGLSSKTDNMTLAELKTFWKGKVTRQAEDHFKVTLGYTIFDTSDAIVALVGTSDPIDRTKNKWTNMKRDTLATRQALNTAKDAITACTTKEQVRAISFVPPA
jgi:nucleoid-associated protein YejK